VLDAEEEANLREVSIASGGYVGFRDSVMYWPSFDDELMRIRTQTMSAITALKSNGSDVWNRWEDWV
jgi:hypothetical protein